MYTITNIEMPKNGDFGILQINNLENTYFRFEMMEGAPVLDTSLFADALEDVNDKHQNLSKESELYRGVQKSLGKYIQKLNNKKSNLVVQEEQPKLYELIQCIENRMNKKTLKEIIGYFNRKLPSIRKDIDDFKCDITLSERKILERTILHTDILAKDCIGRIYVFKISFCPESEASVVEKMVFWEHRITEIYNFVAAGGQK